jgi:hypothetical protein
LLLEGLSSWRRLRPIEHPSLATKRLLIGGYRLGRPTQRGHHGARRLQNDHCA